MKKLTKILMVSTLLVGGMFFLLSMSNVYLTDWPVPAKYKNMKNPMKGKADKDGIGKELWAKHCKACHGIVGHGDGKKAANLDTEMRDLTSAEVKKQTDGELYYKSIIGRDEMPNYEKKIPTENDRWLLINYMRTLK